ncbi:P-type conjugative transfer protein VirB9 [Azospirillum melinis]|uniref:P-type conjugative transfer protein VirB9 n=1 Tax=Azospirillum melinis TaxID=328839 RepID=A0ABX2KJK2_9PROT|nr:TrbG/VirB9 family P-type conjugative transfer protein [Azospirillum melinis]MBP2307498.1 type IV secretion system protein VirB9 [Azospirillum melinis]NUB01943.1 P-type conjugative transfer protein VirB9 [Azospirillum melinis]
MIPLRPARMAAGLLVGAVLAAGAVRAEQAPKSGGFDTRVQLVVYNSLDVVRIVGCPTTSTQITFATGEEITQVSIGDAEAWLAQPAANMLFLKPTEVRAATNAQVVTRRADGSLRSYQLHLIAEQSGKDTGCAIYAVRFRYPQDERAERADRRTQAAEQIRERDAQARLAAAWTEGPRNWRYVAQGSAALEPAEVSDNGRQTAFRFPGSRRVPAIYAVAPDGSEAIVPASMAGDTAVVQTTARAFLLRDGQEVLRVVNRGFDPAGRDPGTGTGTPDLTRSVRSTGP